MSKVNYYLKSIPKEETLIQLKKVNRKLYNDEVNLKRPIVMSIAYNGNREIFATGKFIPFRFWDKDSMRIKSLLETPKESLEDADWLNAKKIEVEKYLQEAKTDHRQITKDDLYELIKDTIPKKKERENLEEILKIFFAEHKTKAGASIKPNTKKKYASLINHVSEFQNSKIFSPEKYSTDWMKKFKEHLSNVKNLNDNSVCKYIKALKTFITFFKKKGFKITASLSEVKVGETDQIVNILYEEELRALQNMNFNKPIHNEIRDIFVFQCFTGARYSDIENIKQEDIKQLDDMVVWEYISIKNNQRITVPLADVAIKIINKYKNLPTVLPHYLNQIVNEELKKIAKISNLNRKVKTIAYFDNRIREDNYYLHELISTHWARKTFISLSLQKGVSERMVREVSGHKDERSFKRYINLNKTHLVAIRDTWDAFTKSPQNSIQH